MSFRVGMVALIGIDLYWDHGYQQPMSRGTLEFMAARASFCGGSKKRISIPLCARLKTKNRMNEENGRNICPRGLEKRSNCIRCYAYSTQEGIWLPRQHGWPSHL